MFDLPTICLFVRIYDNVPGKSKSDVDSVVLYNNVKLI